MVDHVRAIYNSTGKPIILYNFPLKTDGVVIPVEVIRHLRQENIIIGIKDSSGDLDYLSQLVALRDELGGLGVMNGELKKAYEALKLGVDGLVMSYTNVEPDKCRENPAINFSITSSRRRPALARPSIDTRSASAIRPFRG